MASVLPLDEVDRGRLQLRLTRTKRARVVWAGLTFVLPVGLLAFILSTPSDFGKTSTVIMIALLCLGVAGVCLAGWVDAHRRMVRTAGWLARNEKLRLEGPVTELDAHSSIWVDGVRLRGWERDPWNRLRVGDPVCVEILPSEGSWVLTEVLRINGVDNPYFRNALFIGPPS